MAENKTNRQSNLTTQPIPDLVRRIGFPVSIGVFFNTMFNVVDTFYGGAISKEALAALTLSFPIFFIIIALGSGMATGTIALLGNSLGADNRKEAELFAVHGFVVAGILAILMTIFGLLAAPFLFGILGASGNYLTMALSYIRPIFWGSIFFSLVYMLNAPLTALGDTKPFRNFLVMGFLLNIILDPWFIFGGLGLPPLGLAGIGFATILVQFLGCLYLGYKVYRSGLITARSLTYLPPRLRPMGQIILQGLPTSLDLSTVSIGGFILTFFISQFGPLAVAAFGVASRIDRIIMLPLVGLDVATLSLVAQNNGAGLVDRVRLTIKTAIRYGFILMVIGSATIVIFANPLMRIFTNDPDIIAIGVTYIRISALALLPSTLVFVSFAAMRGLKKPLLAMTMSIARMIVAPALVIYLVTQYFDVGLIGIWWTIVSITLITGIVAYATLTRLLSQANTPVPDAPSLA